MNKVEPRIINLPKFLDARGNLSFVLNRPYQGLYVKPGIWRDLDDFSSGAVCMATASDIYKVEDYI